MNKRWIIYLIVSQTNRPSKTRRHRAMCVKYYKCQATNGITLIRSQGTNFHRWIFSKCQAPCDSNKIHEKGAICALPYHVPETLINILISHVCAEEIITLAILSCAMTISNCMDFYDLIRRLSNIS